MDTSLIPREEREYMILEGRVGPDELEPDSSAGEGGLGRVAKGRIDQATREVLTTLLMASSNRRDAKTAVVVRRNHPPQN